MVELRDESELTIINGSDVGRKRNPGKDRGFKE